MKKIFLFICLSISVFTTAQNEIAWNGKYQLQLSDFQSPATQVGGTAVYSLHTLLGVDFSFAMSKVQFMFTKNFNALVNNNFKRNSASLVAPDTAIAGDLVGFAQYEFDLTELYARKFRKKIFEAKGTFSNVMFFKPLYDEIQKEFSERSAIAGKQTNVGRNKEQLKMLHDQVLKEIGEFDDFCKECKTKNR